MFSITGPGRHTTVCFQISHENNNINTAKEAFSQGALEFRYIDTRGVRQTITRSEEIEPLMQGGLLLRSTGERYFLSRAGLLGGSPLDELEKKLENKVLDKKSVFISYQWGQKELAREIHEEFEKKGFLVIRDETNLSHGVYLPGFMRIINHRNLDYVVVIVSDSYLKSKNCMYEVNQLVNRYNYGDTLLPFVLTDDQNTKADIYGGVQTYLTYWQGKLNEARAASDLIDEDVIQNIMKNCQTFANTVRTRINVSEGDLKKQKFQPFFDLIDTRERSKERNISKEIEALLNKALALEKMKKVKEAEECYTKAIRSIEEFLHLDGLDPVCARLYGRYSEFLKRQNRFDEARTNLEIACNFGYETDASGPPSSQFKQTEMPSNLNNKDFSPLGKAEQQGVLAKLTNYVWDELAIRNSSALTEPALREFNFSKLVALNLSGCLNLTSQVIKQLITQAPTLRKLNLSGILSIEEIQEVNFDYYGQRQPSPVNLRKLQEIILNHCGQLKGAMIEGDELSKAEFEGCNLVAFTIKSPKLNFLNLKDNKKITDRSFDDGITESRDALTILNVEGCDQLSEHEFRMKFPDYPFLYFIPLSAVSEKRQVILDILTKEEVSLDPFKWWSSGTWETIEKGALIEAIKRTKTLKKISGFLRFCVPSDECKSYSSDYISSISSALTGNKSLVELDLSNSRVVLEGPKNGRPNEKELDIIDDVIRQALASTTLQKLDLSGNRLDHHYAARIAEALKTNQSLTHLNLLSNPLNSGFVDERGYLSRYHHPSYRYGSTEGVISLFRVLQSKTSLVELKIDKFFAFEHPLGKLQIDRHRVNYALLEETIAAAQQANPSLKILHA